MYKIVLVSLLFSTTSFAKTACEKRIKEIKKEYAQNGKKINSYTIKNCSKVISDIQSPFDSNRNTNAPKIYESSACAILATVNNAPVREVLIIDDENEFELLRDFDNEDKITFGHSRSGNSKTGSISFIKKEGNYIDDLGFLNKIRYITRADYDLENNKVRLLKWKLKLFSNKYSHDYTVQCK
jgi:hypothetical protein